ncbi:MAG: hypothetical protein ACQEWF_22390 [Bacillota bacterium]
MKKAFFIVILSLSLFFLAKHTYATIDEPDPSPISFQIEIQNWAAVNESLPKNSKFTVVDVESSKSFDVQRRAGSGHAEIAIGSDN